MKKSIAIVGGGILGMTISHHLALKGCNVTLIESGSALGGLASAWELNGITWDKFYHVISASDSYLLSLLKELNLEAEISWSETKTGFFTDGKLHSMSNTLEFIKFPPLDIINKLRLGLTIFRTSHLKNWRKLEQISVREWLLKWSGKKTFEKIWLPLLKSKLGESYRATSAAFIWATIQRMYRARHSSKKKEMFGYVNGGYSVILNRLQRLLEEENVKMCTNFIVKSVEDQNNGKIRIISQDTREVTSNSVILTIPSPFASNVCDQLSFEEKNKLNATKYLGVICVSILIKKPLSRYYVINITDQGFPFTGIIEMSALVDKKYFEGNSLVYLPKYLDSDDPLFSQSDDRIKEDFIAGLRRVHPQLSADDILCSKVARAKYVFVLPTLNYSGKLPSISTTVPGVFVLNSSHIVNGTLNVNETIGLVHNKLNEIINSAKFNK